MGVVKAASFNWSAVTLASRAIDLKHDIEEIITKLMVLAIQNSSSPYSSVGIEKIYSCVAFIIQHLLVEGDQLKLLYTHTHTVSCPPALSNENT